ncbi:MAG: hypothetical protein AAF969_06805 [Bacteroidota bacterium]
MEKKLNKINEHWLIPTLWCFIIASLAVLGYLVNEFFSTEYELSQYYGSAGLLQEEYRQNILIYVLCYLLLISAEVLSIKFKKGWLFVLLIGINIFLFAQIPSLLG